MTSEPLLTAAEQADLVRLLRFVAPSGVCQMSKTSNQGSAQVMLERPDGVCRAFAPRSLFLAKALGLAHVRGQSVQCLAPAKAFLKRAKAAGEEAAWQSQHADILPLLASPGDASAIVRVNLDESPLAQLARRKDRNGERFLGDEAVAAGNRLHADFTRAHLQPRLTQSFAERVDGSAKSAGGSGVELTDTAVAARMRFNAAMSAMGPDLSGVAIDICCFMKGFETVEQERQWPQRSAKLMLRTALGLLHRHYHPEPPIVRRQPMQHWGDEGYRPEMKR